VQISAYFDAWIASFLISGSVAALTYAQTLALLPVSLFGMSVSASELPEMSRLRGDEKTIATDMRTRLEAGLRRIAFWIIPSATAFLAIGDVITGLVYQSGRFNRATAQWVWLILAGSAIGLLATTLGRLYSSSLYAMRDTKTPFRFAVVRVALSIVLAYIFAFPLRAALGLPPRWGAAGITAASSIAGCVEFALLRNAVGKRLGRTTVPPRRLVALWTAAALGAVGAWAVRLALPFDEPLTSGAIIISVFGIVYFAVALSFGVEDAAAVARRLRLRR
jgi:putative peptidoglycan lipid II flippase